MINKNAEIMNAEQVLIKYLMEHPDYWDYENEVKEVERLKRLCVDANLEK